MSASVPTSEEFVALIGRVEALEAQLAARTEQPEWLTIPAAAHYLGRSEQAVRKLIDRHHIPKHQEIRGGRIMLRRDELDAALTTPNPVANATAPKPKPQPQPQPQPEPVANATCT